MSFVYIYIYKTDIFITLSPCSWEISKCLWQQTTASSKRPNTFKVFPRFPLAFPSPILSPIVLGEERKKKQKIHRCDTQFLKPGLLFLRVCITLWSCFWTIILESPCLNSSVENWTSVMSQMASRISNNTSGVLPSKTLLYLSLSKHESKEAGS